jgi:hypothetical protein
MLDTVARIIAAIAIAQWLYQFLCVKQREVRLGFTTVPDQDRSCRTLRMIEE